MLIVFILAASAVLYHWACRIYDDLKIKRLKIDLMITTRAMEWVKHSVGHNLYFEDGHVMGLSETGKVETLTSREEALFYHAARMRELQIKTEEALLVYRQKFIDEFRKNPANKDKQPEVPIAVVSIAGLFRPNAGIVKPV